MRVGMVGLMLACGAALGAIATIVTDAHGRAAVRSPRSAVENVRIAVRSGAPQGFYLRVDFDVIAQREVVDEVPAIDARCRVGDRTYEEIVAPERVRGTHVGHPFAHAAWLWAHANATLPAEPTRCVLVFHDAARSSFSFAR